MQSQTTYVHREFWSSVYIRKLRVKRLGGSFGLLQENSTGCSFFPINYIVTKRERMKDCDNQNKTCKKHTEKKKYFIFTCYEMINNVDTSYMCLCLSR